MAEVNTSPVTGRYAIVTGANRGIGFEICRQLAAKGITVVLTARDEKRGREAAEKLRGEGLSGDVVFHQVDVTDPDSVASLVDFIKTKFGKLDILINNAGISGVIVEGDELVLKQLLENHRDRIIGASSEENKVKANGKVIETYELGEQSLQINYYAAKRMIDSFIPLLQLSDLPRIVNVTASMGKFKFLSNEWAIGMLSDVENLTDERIDEVLNEFLKDFKEDFLQAKNWPHPVAAYKVSKAALNAYTRIIAKKYPTICTNAVCPGYVKTDMTANSGQLSVEEGAEGPVKLALLPDGGPSGLFFRMKDETSF